MWMQTFTGKKIDFKNIKPDDICIEDIAHSLSQIARFGGHAKKRYSVAEHCILGARIAEPELKFSFLMHDAAEAYIGDIVKPWKEVLAENGKLIEVENNLNDLIQKKFKFKFKADSPEMKKLDSHMIRYEAPCVFECVVDNWHRRFEEIIGHKGFKLPFIEFMNEEKAEQEFLKMFYKLAYEEAEIHAEIHAPQYEHKIPNYKQYVLATEYEDGSPTHKWAVGFVRDIRKRPFKIILKDFGEIDSEEFARIEMISEEAAGYLLSNAEDIERDGSSLWYYKFQAERRSGQSHEKEPDI